MTPAEDSQASVIAFLENPATHGGNAVERISTHGAHVFLAGASAFKLKRAVKLPFFDFSSPAKRRRMLETELELNKPWAPDIYHEVRPVCASPSGGLQFGGDGQALDWVLVMRRFPQDALLDNIAAAGGLTEAMADDMADMAAAMHRAAPVVRDPITAAFRRAALDNVDALRAANLPADLVARLDRELTFALDAAAAHLDRRAAGGFVRHTHGDLHLGNMALLAGKPTPFDALEFDPALATGDTYYDLAFVLMDLEHRNLRPLANRLLNRYVGLTDDIEGLRALPLFLAVRAAVRAKVAAIAAEQALDAEPKATAREKALSYATLASEYLNPVKPCLVGVGGLSGTGKSALARALAPTVSQSPGAIVLRSDVIRKRQCGATETTRLPKTAYTAAASTSVYAQIFVDARRCLAAGASVIADAVFAAPAERRALEDIATSAAVPFAGVWLDAPLAIRLARVRYRVGDASDADPAVAQAQERYDLTSLTWSLCDAGGTADQTLEQARQLVEIRSLPAKP